MVVLPLTARAGWTGAGVELGDLWHWFTIPLSGNSVHVVGTAVSWHGRLMVLAWGVLIPLGIIVARFFKVMPQQDWPHTLDNKFWWHFHRLGQWSAVGLMSAALVLIWGHAEGASAMAQWHATLGWVLAAVGWLQVAGGYLRGTKGGPLQEKTREPLPAQLWRGDHYDMTSRRKGFERAHKGLGYAALLLATCVLLMGLWVADAPRWMVAALVCWWLLWGAVFTVLQSRGWCLDTYQAIWGPSTRHPGNQIEPIGWGVRRHPSPQEKT